MPTRSGIPTTYRTQRFRSRLEARWAAFFDLVGWRWTYEPFDTNGWIPDFLIAGALPFLVEVGPVATEAEYREKAAKPLVHVDRPTFVVGVGPILHGAVSGLPWSYAGLLVNELGDGRAWLAEWARCPKCSAIGILDDAELLPCGHGFTSATVADSLLEDLWAQAGNAVQWQR